MDPERFGGVCYLAANRLCLGQTKGRPDEGRTRKDVYEYALAKRCHEILLYGPHPRKPGPRRTPAPEVAAAGRGACSRRQCTRDPSTPTSHGWQSLERGSEASSIESVPHWHPWYCFLRSTARKLP